MEPRPWQHAGPSTPRSSSRTWKRKSCGQPPCCPTRKRKQFSMMRESFVPVIQAEVGSAVPINVYRYKVLVPISQTIRETPQAFRRVIITTREDLDLLTSMLSDHFGGITGTVVDPPIIRGVGARDPMKATMLEENEHAAFEVYAAPIRESDDYFRSSPGAAGSARRRGYPDRETARDACLKGAGAPRRGATPCLTQPACAPARRAPPALRSAPLRLRLHSTTLRLRPSASAPAGWPIDQAHAERAVRARLLEPRLPEANAVGQTVSIARSGQQFEEEIGILGIKGTQSFRLCNLFGLTMATPLKRFRQVDMDELEELSVRLRRCPLVAWTGLPGRRSAASWRSRGRLPAMAACPRLAVPPSRRTAGLKVP